MNDTHSNIYSPEFVRDLFDEMSATYRLVNVVSSLGFCIRWRRQCVESAAIHPENTVGDLMSGMGELWPLIAAQVKQNGRISAVDISSAMCDRARRIAPRLSIPSEVLVQDALRNSIPDSSADVVVSSFGLKTFDDGQLRNLANEVARILKPGGKMSFLEISVPRFMPLRVPYLFYIGRIIPLIGWLFLGNPANYRLLGVYTESFGTCENFLTHCAGLTVRHKSYFFGCATGVIGEKPG